MSKNGTENVMENENESNIVVDVVNTEESNREGGLRTTLAKRLDEY